MTIAERFDRLVPLLIQREALRAQLRAVEAAMADDEEFAKEYFRERPGKSRHRGVEYRRGKTYTRINEKKARRLLGARAVEAEYEITPESVVATEEAKAGFVVRDASATLRPIRRAEKASA